jgi:DNA-binding CsgD family transcriptional regulator
MSSMEHRARRAATPEEAKALAHPLRLRILRLCIDQALTNRQLAERLGRDPGTVLHHVRTLVATGFLVPDEVRQGEKGALEKPYHSTGKSWSLSLDEGPAVETSASQAMLEAFLAELAEAGPGAATGFSSRRRCRRCSTSSRPGRPTRTASPTACCSPCTAGRTSRPPVPEGEEPAHPVTLSTRIRA